MKRLNWMSALALLLLWLCVALPMEGQDDPPADDAPAAEEPADEAPADEPAEEPADEAPADEPAEEPANEEPAEEPANEEPAEEPANEEPAEEPASEETPAEEPAAEPEAEVKVILSSLDNPSGVAIQPETGRVFVSDSGMNRVVSFDPADQNPVRVDVAGDKAAIDVYGKGPMYNIGPLGLLFLDQNTLVVGGGDKIDSEELMRIFDVSGSTPLKLEEAVHTLGPIGPSEASEKGEGNFYGLAASKTAVYITSNGDDTKGWVLRIPLADGQPAALEPFIATKVATSVDAPVGIALNRDGHIVIGQMGEVNVPGDSLYTVYDPETGELKAQAETGLHDIAGLAYSPTSGKLYAVDFAWVDPTLGGLFRLDVSEEESTVTATKICSLDKPSALAFTPDGTCYVTIFGTAAEGDVKKPGKLVRIVADL